MKEDGELHSPTDLGTCHGSPIPCDLTAMVLLGTEEPPANSVLLEGFVVIPDVNEARPWKAEIETLERKK